MEVKLDEMDLIAAESKSTYEEIKEYVLEHTGLKVSNLYIAQVKRKCGIIGRENYIRQSLKMPYSQSVRQRRKKQLWRL